jgi:hypothetical protein
MASYDEMELWADSLAETYHKCGPLRYTEDQRVAESNRDHVYRVCFDWGLSGFTLRDGFMELSA